MLLTSSAALLLFLVPTHQGPALQTAPAAQSEVLGQDSLELRLEGLVTELESAAEASHVSGMAIAIVRGDEVILSRGFGLADRESGRGVTPETLFAIGSTTKSFTSALIGSLIDEGRMDWDDRVTKFLPDFELQIDASELKSQEAAVTLRDLLCHRTGFTRMGVLWYEGLADRATILTTATKAEPWSPFRKAFFYNNVMYLAAGEAAAVAGEQSWDELIQDRFLGPLGMSSSSTATAVAQADERLALGYSWDAEGEVFVRAPMRTLDSIGPAGSINSNVIDMAQWLRFQLGRGAVDGLRLISAERLEQTREAHIDVGPNLSYGLGWFTEMWEGRRVVQHGGNIDGFSSTLAFLPDDDLGFVLLTNASATVLQDASRAMVWEALLGAAESAAVTLGQTQAGNSTEELQAFTGTYIANYAQFKDEEFVLTVRDGALVLDIPSQREFRLLAPDAEGRRGFASMPQAIQASFVQDQEGQVTNLILHQGGMDSEIPRKGFVPEPDGNEADFARYYGSYDHPMLPEPFSIRYVAGRVVCTIPGQGEFPLHLPNDEGLWVFRSSKLLGIEFQESESGEVVGAVFHERGTKSDCPLLERGESEFPSLEEFLALRASDRAGERVDQLGSVRFTGSLRLVHAGITGTTAVTVSAARDKILTDDSQGVFGWQRTGVSKESAWSKTAFSPLEEFDGYRAELMRLSNPLMTVDDLRRYFDKIEVLSMGELEGRKVIKVALTRGDLPAWTGHFDAQTGDMVRLEVALPLPTGGVVRQDVRLADFREEYGLRFPHEVISENVSSGRSVVTHESIEVGLDLAADFFDPR